MIMRPGRRARTAPLLPPATRAWTAMMLVAGATILLGAYAWWRQYTGGFIVTGLRNRDPVNIVGTVTILVLVFLLVNLIVDLLYGVLDPRISHD